MIDEYLAARVLGANWPATLPDEELALPASHHWRLLQAIHGGQGGQLTRILTALSHGGRDAIRHPHPEVLTVLDTRPLLDEAARITARFGGGWLIGETLAAGLAYGHRLYFGNAANVGRTITTAATELAIRIEVVG